MAIEEERDFVFIQKKSIRVAEILSLRLDSWVDSDANGNPISGIYPKIIVVTARGAHEFIYGIGEDEKRDEEFKVLSELVDLYQEKIKLIRHKSPFRVTGLNIASNSGSFKKCEECINKMEVC